MNVSRPLKQTTLETSINQQIQQSAISIPSNPDHPRKHLMLSPHDQTAPATITKRARLPSRRRRPQAQAWARAAALRLRSTCSCRQCVWPRSCVAIPLDVDLVDPREPAEGPACALARLVGEGCVTYLLDEGEGGGTHAARDGQDEGYNGAQMLFCC